MLLLLIFVLLFSNLFSLAFSTNSTNQNCTEQMKALATLKFQVCKTELFQYCDKIEFQFWSADWDKYEFCSADWDKYEFCSADWDKYEGKYLKESDPENFKEDNPCGGNNTSCGYLDFLVDVCGAQYGVCHGDGERIEIMRMWIKQFIRETVRKANRHEDNSTEIKTGHCNHRLAEFFGQEEVEEITDFVEDAYIRKFETSELNYMMINYATNISNKDFGVLLDKDRKQIGSQYSNDNSSWAYCTWKLTQKLMGKDDKLDYSMLNNFLDCDGKCDAITLHEDSAEVHTEKYRKVARVLDDTFGCFRSVGFGLSRVDFTDKYKGRIGLCNSFQVLLNNCSIPVGQCLGNVAIREVVMAKMLQGLLLGIENTIRLVQENYEDPTFLGDFNFEDCKIFGGNGATLVYASSTQILIAILRLMTQFDAGG